jgi:hypothetical protein
VTRVNLLLGLLAATLLCVGTGACGASKALDPASTPVASRRPPTAGTPASGRVSQAGHYLKGDGDKDNDDEGRPEQGKGDDREFLEGYGPRASQADARSIAALVKRYLAVSAAGEAARACSLLSTGMAAGLAGAPHQPGRSTGQACATAFSPLLREQRQRLVAEDVATLAVTSVHVKGDLGLIALAFENAPESELLVEREGRQWKIGALFDTNMA